ncbi:c6 transcription [Diplodia corticola]|uniref:C6 transcription n=1 Tax=Diplodia corticola TaxID=236234 RepID=A0A1J9R170_9PEZI|nr:c6 transcription [Diplodia corticola]OJD34002.1 c6 transcription [Diplodia corticola]
MPLNWSDPLADRTFAKPREQDGPDAYYPPSHQVAAAVAPVPERPWSVPPAHEASPQSPSSYPPPEVLNDLLIQYEQRCNHQPLPLFSPGFASHFSRTYESRDDELVSALLATAFRLVHEHDHVIAAEASATYAARTNDLITKRLNNGGVSLATIQALCLLSFWEFTGNSPTVALLFHLLNLVAGQKDRSWLHLNITLSLAQESGLTKEPDWDIDSPELEERRRCAWSLYVLSCTLGLEPPLPVFTCRFPGAIRPQRDGSPQTSTQDTEIILANSIKLYEIWGRVQNFAAQSGAEAGKSLWTGDSEYGSIVSALMDYESQFPDEHRFSEQTAGAFSNNPAYWAPWFSIQFMYHAILCVLNHPFLLSVRLDPIKDSTPRTFRQSTSDQVKLHSYWAFRFITVAREFDYAITDPYIAYAITVAATIFDHYRLSGETQARRDAQDKFIKCMAFVRKVGRIWPIAANMAQLLQSLERTTTAQIQTDTNYSRERIEILWTLLSYSAVSASCSESVPSLFSESLLPQHARRSSKLVDMPAYQSIPACLPSLSRATSGALEMQTQGNQAQLTADPHGGSNTPLAPEIRQFEQSLQTTLLDDVLGASFEWWDQGNL